MSASLPVIVTGSLASAAGSPGLLFVPFGDFSSRRCHPTGTVLQDPDAVSPNKTNSSAQGESGDPQCSPHSTHWHES